MKELIDFLCGTGVFKDSNLALHSAFAPTLAPRHAVYSSSRDPTGIL